VTSRIQSATPAGQQGGGAGQPPHPTADAPIGRQNGYGARVSLDELHDTARRIAANVERVLVGKPDVIRIALVTLLAEGHLLVEDVPGVGKTSLAKALARSIDCTVSRVQFTPDLLPSDVTGVSIYNRQTGEFEFRPGPVFANIVVGDEINRASPKTQSALLECMEEHQVTVDTSTYTLGAPFMVIATQNPIEMEGTYALPEAHIAPEVRRYAVELVAATRQVPEIRLGASPRATLHLVRAARAQAALTGREYVVPDDLHTVAVPVLAHRLVLTTEAHAARRSATDVVRAVLHRVPVPQGSAGTR
jgi:MoxR-like ATPase